MLYHLLYPLTNHFIGFNVFRYVTFRSVYAAVTAFGFCLLYGGVVIAWMRAKQLGEKIRHDGPASHSAKAGTPTMGGILIVAAILVSTLLWMRWDSKFLWLAVFAIVSFGLIGFADDYLKMVGIGGGRGISGMWKLISQMIVAIVIVYGYLAILPDDFHQKTAITLPFFKHPLDIGVMYPILAFLVIVGASNGVNLTDGMDGLAIGCTTFASMAFVVVTYIVGNAKFSEYLKIIQVPGASELTILCSAVVGAGLGFLWFNASPAQIFMGDTGSLVLGGLLGTVAVMVKQEFLLIIVGGIFVVEAFSVIAQVTSFKMRGKRIFKMAPLHHHFELSGVPESKLVVRFWIVAIILTLLTLSTLKLR
ncbi:MAG TPA: phospho-N-acetylmuramoyl-pentapeptide-transferase [bacterium]|nr:phospho-N-acetylmuramoyl-pentapeptide-transferase [bacterium]